MKLLLATLIIPIAALAPSQNLNLDEGECGPFAANMTFIAEPVDSPFVPQPPPEEWDSVITWECRDTDSSVERGNSSVRQEIYVVGSWYLNEDTVDEIPDTVLDTMRWIVILADAQKGDTIVPPIVPDTRP